MKNKQRTVLISGAGGYIGSVMVGYFLNKGYKVKAFDRYYFGLQVLDKYISNEKLEVITGDIRSIDNNILKNVDLVIDLASISNDPAADLNPGITIDINIKGAINLAIKAKESGVSRYIYASSCSVYGESDTSKLTETSVLKPVSLYARSKVLVENELLNLSSDSFIVTVARNATCYGLSPRMRFDLAINIMTHDAFFDGQIKVKGGGKQWRPFVHIADVAMAYYIISNSDTGLINKQIFNVGSDDQNYQMVTLAEIISRELGVCEIVIVPEDPDKRNYNVSFSRITNVLGFTPKIDVSYGVREILKALTEKQITKDRKSITVEYYKELIELEKRIDMLKYNNRLL